MKLMQSAKNGWSLWRIFWLSDLGVSVLFFLLWVMLMILLGISWSRWRAWWWVCSVCGERCASLEAKMMRSERIQFCQDCVADAGFDGVKEKGSRSLDATAKV